jgi:hypothetical protein
VESGMPMSRPEDLGILIKGPENTWQAVTGLERRKLKFSKNFVEIFIIVVFFFFEIRGT